METLPHVGKSDERLLREIEDLERVPNDLAVSDVAWFSYQSLCSELTRRRHLLDAIDAGQI